jgi:serine-type D-Ala-D-Ala carboxypeptidase
MSARRFDPAVAVAARQVEAGEVPFVILAFGDRAGAIRLEVCSPATGSRMNPGSACLIASITKPIVATAVLRLAQEGRFPLAAPLSRWVPELEAAGLAPFTAWHVMTHTTGIADVSLVDLLVEGGDRAELVRRTIAAGQGWPPGSRFLYASFTWDLLAAAIERALDRPFEELLGELVLAPLGMTDTTFGHTPGGAPRATVRIGEWDGVSQLPDGIDEETAVNAYSSLRLAGGGLWSTAHDLLRFGRAMLRGGELDGERVLGRAVLDLMTREVTVNGLGATGDAQQDEHYAVGWGKAGGDRPGSAAAFGHGGISGTRLWIDPAEDLVFVYLTGQWGGAGEAIDAVQLATYGCLE